MVIILSAFYATSSLSSNVYNDNMEDVQQRWQRFTCTSTKHVASLGSTPREREGPDDLIINFKINQFLGIKHTGPFEYCISY